jgi:hypothetical protein
VFARTAANNQDSHCKYLCVLTVRALGRSAHADHTGGSISLTLVLLCA